MVLEKTLENPLDCKVGAHSNRLRFNSGLRTAPPASWLMQTDAQEEEVDEEEAGLFTCSQSRRRRRQQRQHHWIRQSQHLPHISILSTQLPSGSKPTTIKNTDKHVPHLPHTPHPTSAVSSCAPAAAAAGVGVENKTPGSRRIPAFPHPRGSSRISS